MTINLNSGGFIAGAMLGLMLLYLTRVEDIVSFIFNRIGISRMAATFISLAFGFWGIRFFGQGLLTMVSRNMVMKWFNKKRGLANAVLGIFSAFGFSMAPKIFNQIIEKLEWQGAWLLLAGIIGFGFVTFVLIFYRDNPKDSGCIPDGKRISNKKSKRPPSLPERDYSLSEARKTRAFWAFTLGMTLTALYISGLTFNVVSVFDSVGLCGLLLLGIWMDEIILMLEAATGDSYNEEDLHAVGERIWNLERVFNIKAGFSGKDDTLLQRST